MYEYFHSVTLDKELCKGCTNCVKRCPTEAIRVRDGKARIIRERCIDCGQCIRVCPHHAKLALVDPLDILKSYKYTIALPAPTLYGQFKKLEDVNVLLTALLHTGFDDVFEVAAAAETISAATRGALAQGNLLKPAISSACPAVVRLIRVRFPQLLENVLSLYSPMELAARWASRLAVKKTGLPAEDIGCIFISPCPAKVTAVKAPICGRVTQVSGVISIADLMPRLLPAIKKVTSPLPLSRTGSLGMGWASSGGECSGILRPDYLAADGIENVIRVLEAIEDEKISDIDFVELNACTGGCVGGALTVSSPFVSRARIRRLKGRTGPPLPVQDPPAEDLWCDLPLTPYPVMRLDNDIATAMAKLNRVREYEKMFNEMDCGACGAPSCRAMAEDIVQGEATEDQCIFVMRSRLQELLAAKEGNGS